MTQSCLSLLNIRCVCGEAAGIVHHLIQRFCCQVAELLWRHEGSPVDGNVHAGVVVGFVVQRQMWCHLQKSD